MYKGIETKLPSGEKHRIYKGIETKLLPWGEAPDGSMQMFTWAVGRSASWVVKEIVMASTIMPPLPRYWPPARQRILAPMDLNRATNCFFLPSTDCNHQFCTILWRSKLGWDDSQRKDFVRRRRREPCTWFWLSPGRQIWTGAWKGMIWVSPTWPKTMRLMSKIGEAGKGEWWPRAQVLSSHQWVIKYSRRDTKYNTTQIQTHYKCDQILGRPNTGRQEPTSTLFWLRSPDWANAIIHFLDVLTVAWGANISKLLALLIFPTKTQI